MKQLATIILSLLALQAVGQSGVASQQKTYQPPMFTDPNRLKIIEATIPAIEKIYRDYAAQKHFPGLTFGIVVDGKLIHAGAVGYTDVAKKTPATPQSVFRIASMTKSITALAILKLRDEGKLRLDEPVATYIPDVAKLTYLTADAPVLTVRNLMTHSGGFPEDNPWGDRQLADSDADLLTLMKGGVSFANVPGVAYEYSNLGFALLGRIITNVSGKPYQQYITETILKPLGMTHTEWEYTNVPTNQLALGYRWVDGNWVEEPLLHDGSYGAMGGLLTSIEDFSKYVAFHLAAWPPRNDAEPGSPVRRSSVREMHIPRMFSGFSPNFRFPSGRATPLVSHYAYGLGWTRDGDSREYVAHSGGLPGFGSQWRIMTDYGVGVIAFANLTYANIGAVNWAVLDTLLAAGIKPRQLPVSPILSQRKAELVALLPDWANAEKALIFAENFFPDHSLDNRRKAAQALFTKLGKVVRVGELIPENQLRGQFLIEGTQATIRVFFTLTPENPALIQQLDMTEITRKL
jgi:CubicO group peptidase (beta-lactamase class C family)